MQTSKKSKFVSLILAISMCVSLAVPAGTAAAASVTGSNDTYDGSQLWLNYTLSTKADDYQEVVKSIIVEDYDANPAFRHSRPTGTEGAMEEWTPVRPEDATEVLASSTLGAARAELGRALPILLGVAVPYATEAAVAAGAVVVGTPDSSGIIAGLSISELAAVGDEGYVIQSVEVDGKAITVIAANTDIGALYGTFAFLRLMQTNEDIDALDVSDSPKVPHRRLNNWDTERLYASTALTGEGEGSGGPGSNGGSNDGGNGSMFVFMTAGSDGGVYKDDLLPEILDRYIVFARACASLGINEININNVNAKFEYLSENFILMEAALADALRPYGVKIALSVRYVSPTNATCNTAADVAAGGPAIVDANDPGAYDPYNSAFQNWWAQKLVQIKTRIPDFVGFTVKANSEGQPGPQDYGNDHGDGAYGIGNAMTIAEATIAANAGGTIPSEVVDMVAENPMTLFWRTFVYEPGVDRDRLARAYKEFTYIDQGKSTPTGTAGERAHGFEDHVFIQTKNGPLDFQGREPVNPLFGAMPNTNQAIELQITKEYTGHHIQLCYLAPMWEEVFKTDTGYAHNDGGTALVGEIIDGSAQGHVDTAIVGVNNIGNAANMTGHEFDQANFYAFGRQAWNWELNSEDIAEEWTRMTWGNDEEVVETIVAMMMGSWEALVSYTTPFGIGHQMGGTGTHYFPNPGQIILNGGLIRDDWSPAYYNQISGVGLGFNRTTSAQPSSFGPRAGSGLTAQYSPAVKTLYESMENIPEDLLLWFHHVPWNFEMDSGRTFYDEAIYRTQMGVQHTTWMKEAWESLEGKIDAARYADVARRLWRQEIDAGEWRDFYRSQWGMNSGMEVPVDDAPLSIVLTVDGETYQGFDLAVDSFNKTVPGNLPNTDARYTEYAKLGTVADFSRAPFSSIFVPVETTYKIVLPTGADMTDVSAALIHAGDVTGADIDVTNLPNGARVRVSGTVSFGTKPNGEEVFGNVVKYYDFVFVKDTSLKSITVNGKELETFDPAVLDYTVMVPPTQSASSTFAAEASDPAATVSITGANGVAATKTITVTNGTNTTVYTVRTTKDLSFAESFNGSSLGEGWSWMRQSSADWTLGNGALTIDTRSGDIQGATNTAENILLRDLPNGDWELTTKISFNQKINQPYQQAGIIVYQNDDNYVKFGIEYTGTVNANTGAVSNPYTRIILAREMGGTYADVFYDALEMDMVLAASNNTVYLKLVKEGNDYKAFWGTDPNMASGTVPYESVGFYTAPAAFTPSRVGLLAMNRTRPAAAGLADSVKASFDYFNLTSNYVEEVPAAVGTITFPGGSTAPGETVTVGADTVTVAQNATTDSSGNYTATVSSATVSSALGKAEEGDTLVLEPAISGAVADGKTVTITAPKSLGTSVEKSAADAVEFASPAASVTMNAEGLTDLGNQARTNVGVATTQNKDGSIDVDFLADGKAVDSFAGIALVSVPVTGSNYVAVMVDENGNETPILFSAVMDGELVALVDGSCTIALRKVDANFADMASHWSKNDTAYVVGLELFIGTSDTTYSPEATVTLATLPQVLYRMAGSPELGEDDVYPGIEADKWYSDAMNWLGGNILGADSEEITKLSPDGEVSTEVLMTLLHGYCLKAGLVDADAKYDIPAGKFGADTVSGYAQDAMNWAVGTGLLIGNEDGIVVPGATVTRAVLTTIIARFVKQQITL